LVVEAPVPGGECWFRVITNEDHITKDRTLHYQALKGKQFWPSSGKEWSHELSGRIVSLAGDLKTIEADARAFAQQIRDKYPATKKPTKLTFVGVACRRVADLQSSSLDRLKTDVVYTPEGADCAHSDIVVYGAQEDASLDPIRYWLMATFRIISPSQLSLLVSSCGEASPRVP
jgi:hypothetical protein